MTIRYVGPGGNNSNDGLSWANRKLTINGVEDTPVVAGDIIYIAPGVYRESPTIDVSGSSGLPITYIGDITGEHTSGSGGYVRITGSDNDTTNTRGSGIYSSGKSYRTFRGLAVDLCNLAFSIDAATYMIIEDCFFGDSFGSGLYISGSGSYITVRRCVFMTCNQASGTNGIFISHSSLINSTNSVIEDCILIGSGYYGIYSNNYGGLVIKNCWVEGSYYNVYQSNGSATYPAYIYNSIITGGLNGLYSSFSGYLIEDYNNVLGNQTDRSANVSTGSHSISTAVATEQKKLIQGFDIPWNPYYPRDVTNYRRKTGTSTPTEDIYGITRPTTESKKSWGPVQYQGYLISDDQYYDGGYSLYLEDAGRAQFYIPTSGSSTFAVYVYRGPDYAGTLPQMVIKRPGHSDVTVTDTGSAQNWNLLQSFLYFPDPPELTFLELVSNNTATSGSCGCWFDFLNIS